MPTCMEDGQEITAFIDDCIVLGLGINRAVNKLTALLAAAKFQNPDTPAIRII